MQEAIITSTVDLTSGGCNACGLVEDTVYISNEWSGYSVRWRLLLI